MKRYSEGLMIGGIALLVLGAMHGVVGAALFASDPPGHGDFSGFVSIGFGVPVLALGLGCILGGIPMAVIGARKVPDRAASVLPRVVPTRGGTALEWAF